MSGENERLLNFKLILGDLLQKVHTLLSQGGDEIMNP